MTIKIDWHKIPSQQEDEDRYYPRVKSSRTITDEELFKKASKHSVIDRATYYTAVYGIANAISEELRKGNAVSLKELGTFRLQIGTESLVEASDRSKVGQVKMKGVNFTPSPDFLEQMQGMEFEWMPDVVSQKDMTDDQVMAALRLYFKDHEAITREEFEKLIHRHRSYATKRLNSLIDKGLLEKIGYNKYTKYILKG